MIALKVAQLIYTNVEKERSPTGKRGFQTLFYTKDALTEADVEAIEGRLLYYPSESEPTKSLFFRLGDDRIVVARIVPLAEPDKFGRKGRYLGHAFILQVDEFAQIGYHPFVLLDVLSSRFISTVEEALAQGEFETGNIHAVTLQIPEEQVERENALIPEVRQWEGGALKALASLALQAATLQDRKEALTLIGNPVEAEEVLRVVFFLIPPPLRLECSFDTYFAGGNLTFNYFWAVGYPSPPSPSPSYILFDARGRKPLAEVPVPPESPYNTWLFHHLSQRDYEGVAEHKAQAFLLHNFLLACPVETRALEAIPSSVVGPFFDLNRPYVDRMMQRELERVVGAGLSARILAEMRSEYRYRPKELLSALLGGFEPASLTPILYRSLSRDLRARPSGHEMQELETLLREVEHSPLQAILLFWRRNYDRLSRHLETLSDAAWLEAFRLFLPEEDIPLKVFVSPSRLDLAWREFLGLLRRAPGLHQRVSEWADLLIKSGHLEALSQDDWLEALHLFLPEEGVPLRMLVSPSRLGLAWEEFLSLLERDPRLYRRLLEWIDFLVEAGETAQLAALIPFLEGLPLKEAKALLRRLKGREEEVPPKLLSLLKRRIQEEDVGLLQRLKRRWRGNST